MPDLCQCHDLRVCKGHDAGKAFMEPGKYCGVCIYLALKGKQADMDTHTRTYTRIPLPDPNILSNGAALIGWQYF